MSSKHSCRDCCGRKSGPTLDAALHQIDALKDELGAAVAAAAMEHDESPLQALVGWDLTARLRWRADHLERQLRDAGMLPQVPAFPGVSDPARWLAQIEVAKAKTPQRKEDAA